MARGESMIDSRILYRATLIGLGLQLALALAAAFIPWVADHLLMFGRMMMSATAGYLYALQLGRGYAMGALGGAVAGGLCALPATIFSALAGNSPAETVAVGTGICILTGAVGGAFGQMAAVMRKLGL